MAKWTDLYIPYSVAIRLDGVDITQHVDFDSVSLKDTGDSEIETASLSVLSTCPVLPPYEWMELVIVFFTPGESPETITFSGYVARAGKHFFNGTQVLYELKAEGYKTLLSKSKPFQQTWDQTSVNGIVAGLISGGERTEFFVDSGTVGTTIDTWTISQKESIASNIQRLCDENNWVWRVSWSKGILIAEENSDPAPFGISQGSDADYENFFPVENVNVELDGSGIVNGVVLLGGTAVSDLQKYTGVGTGTRTRFYLPHHPINSIVSVRVNGIVKSWGTVGYHNCTERDALVHFDAGYIEFCSSPPLGKEVGIEYTYLFRYSYTAVSAPSQIEYGKNLWKLVEAPWISDDTQASLYTDSLLARQAYSPLRISAEVRRAGLRAGQNIPVKFTSLDLNTTLNIESIGMSFDKSGKPRFALRLGMTETLTEALKGLAAGTTSVGGVVGSSSELGGYYANEDENTVVIGYGAESQGVNTAVLGKAATVSSHIFGALVTETGGIRPAVDGTTALQLQNASGTSILNVDTTNSRVGIGNTAPTGLLSVGSGSPFVVNGSGDIIKIKNLTYSWPATRPANGFLADDGSGNLSWTTLTGAGGVSGAGTDNYIPRWNGTTALENSIIYDDGTGIGIGTTSPAAKLHVVGEIKSSNGVRLGMSEFGTCQADGGPRWVKFATITLNGVYQNTTVEFKLQGRTSASTLQVYVGNGSPYNDQLAQKFFLQNDWNNGIPASYIKIGRKDTGTQLNYDIWVQTEWWESVHSSTLKFYNFNGAPEITYYQYVYSGNDGEDDPVATGYDGTHTVEQNVYFQAGIRPTVDSTTALRFESVSGTNVLDIDTTNARVGIGTTSPSYKLEVSGGSITPLSVYSSSDYQIGLRNTGDTGAGWWLKSYAAGGFALHENGVGDKLVFNDSASGNVYFQNIGNVGIGTTSPAVKLHIQNNISGLDEGGGYGQLRIEDTTGAAGQNKFDFVTRQGANTLGIYDVYNSATRLLIDNAGNVGIGTTSPATALHVVGAATVTGGIRPAADSTTALQLQNVAGTSVLNVDTTNGRVGVGTTGPLSLLEAYTGALMVAENTPSVKTITFSALRGSGNDPAWYVDTGAGIQLRLIHDRQTPNSKSAYIQSVSEAGYSSTVGLAFGTTYNYADAATRMYISGNGNVGIGTTSPGDRLTVKPTSAGGITLREVDDGNDAIRLVAGSTQGYADILHNNVVQVRLDANGPSWFNQGNVGIGTSSPGATLDVRGTLSNTAGTNNLVWLGAAGGSQWAGLRVNTTADLNIDYFTGAAWGTAMTILHGGGNVGIGTTSPGAKLQIDSGIANTGMRAYTVQTRHIDGHDASTNWGNDFIYLNYSSPGKGIQIGDTGTDHPLYVFGEIAVASGIRPHADSTTAIQIKSASGVPALSVDTTNSRIGIGILAPTSRLHIAQGGLGFGMTGLYDGVHDDATPYLQLGEDKNWNGYVANNAYYTGTQYNYVYTGGGGGRAARINLENGGAIGIDTVSGGTNPITWTNRFHVANGGNVGIGTTSPGAKLDVASSSNAMIRVSSTTGAGAYLVAHDAVGSYAALMTSTTSQDWRTGMYGSTTWKVVDATNAEKAPLSIESNTPSNTLFLKSTGNVGIGTVTPNTKLDVVGQIQAGNGFTGSPVATILAISAPSATTDVILGYKYTSTAFPIAAVRGHSWSDGTGYNTGIAGTSDRSNTGTNVGGYFSASSGSANYALVTDLGDVGIGTLAPVTKLHVAGAATITGGIRPAADSTTALQLQNVAGTSILNVDTTNSRVGIGTPTPDRSLVVLNTSGEQVKVAYDASYYAIYGHNKIDVYLNPMAFLVGGVEKARISTGGNVGIGTTSPASALHVVGAATITGGIRPAANSATALQFQDASGTALVTLDTTNNILKTTGYIDGGTFASGTSGYRLNGATGDAEFNNITARGALNVTILQYGQVLATNGSIWVTPTSGKLLYDGETYSGVGLFIIADPDGLTHAAAGSLWSVGDVIRVKEPLLGDVWLTITQKGEIGSYAWYINATQQIYPYVSAVWPAGGTVLNYKQSGAGMIRMTADATNSPYISIATHAGAPWSAITERARLGNLDGITGASGYGLWTDNGFFTGTVHANAGDIAGWTIVSGHLYSGTGANTTGLRPADYPFYAGAVDPSAAQFRVTPAGVLTATSATITGAITANTGYIGGTGGWTIESATIWGGSGSAFSGMIHGTGTTKAFFAGATDKTGAASTFSVTAAGAISATSGTIGGWTLGASSLADAAGVVGMSSLVTGGDDIRFWAGHATPASAAFRVTEAGVLTATNATITGAITASTGSIAGWTIDTGHLYSGTGATRTGMKPGTYPFYAGKEDETTAPFRVTTAGALTATSGAIGGWSLGLTSLISGSDATTVGLDSGGTNPSFYAGSATPTSAPFRVTNAGALTATNANITGTINWAEGKGILDTRGITQDMGGDTVLSTPYGGIGASQNLLEQPNDFSQWIDTSCTVTTNNALGPTEVMDADTLAFGSPGYILLDHITNGQVPDGYVFSVWLKAASTVNVTLRLNISMSDEATQVASVTTTWQRFYVSCYSTFLPYTGFVALEGNNVTVYAWGAQLEKIDFSRATPSVYSPSYSASKQRGVFWTNLVATNPTLTWGANAGLGYSSSKIQMSATQVSGALTVTGGIRPAANSTTALQLQNASGTSILNVDTTNNRIGIGTTSPRSQFEIKQSADDGVSPWLTLTNYNNYYNSGSGIAFGYVNSLGNAHVDNAWIYSKHTGSGNQSNLYFDTRTTADAVGTRLFIQHTGNVGIGTTSPATALHVVGAATITGGIRPAADGTTALQLQNASGTSIIDIDTTNARVGIGTTGPAAKLHVDQSSTTAAIPVLAVEQADVDVEFIHFVGTSTTDASQSLVDAADMSTPGSLKGWLKIYVTDKASSGAIEDGIYFIPFYSEPSAG